MFNYLIVLTVDLTFWKTATWICFLRQTFNEHQSQEHVFISLKVETMSANIFIKKTNVYLLIGHFLVTVHQGPFSYRYIAKKSLPLVR